MFWTVEERTVTGGLLRMLPLCVRTCSLVRLARLGGSEVSRLLSSKTTCGTDRERISQSVSQSVRSPPDTSQL